MLNVLLLFFTLTFSAFLLFSMLSYGYIPRKKMRLIKHVCRLLLLFFKAISLVITIYGIQIAITKVNTVSIVFAAIMLISWILGALFELVRFALERYAALITAAIVKDTDPLVRVYKKVTFKKHEKKEESKTDTYVDGLTEEYKNEIKEKKESEKARREAEKIINRETRREKLKSIASFAKSKIRDFFLDGETEENT